VLRDRAIGLAAALALTTAAATAPAQAPALRAPNVVAISPQLVTSGQPSAGDLARLGAQGFEAVVYLAPPTVSDAVRDEAVSVGKQGIVYVNIPIAFDAPTERDFDAFAGALRGLAGRKVLVHCQINMRASVLVFLYRVIVAKEDPRIAYDSVTRVWAPEGAWKRLIVDLLKKHRVDFEPL
jgi:protein tyrosine phosphatase (PTP) superfamily phosphohydrolase (DUF442 family)